MMEADKDSDTIVHATANHVLLEASFKKLF